MEYKLFDEYITLQSLLKTTGILHSGGAIKGFLTEQTVLFNGEKEERRGKKIRVGDQIKLPEQGITITIVEPSVQEKQEHKEDLEEKARVAQLVKELNKKNPKKSDNKGSRKKQVKTSDKRPVRFPGM